MSVTVDCGEGKHTICSGRGRTAYLFPQESRGHDEEPFYCGCRCHHDGTEGCEPCSDPVHAASVTPLLGADTKNWLDPAARCSLCDGAGGPDGTPCRVCRRKGDAARPHEPDAPQACGAFLNCKHPGCDLCRVCHHPHVAHAAARRTLESGATYVHADPAGNPELRARLDAAADAARSEREPHAFVPSDEHEFCAVCECVTYAAWHTAAAARGSEDA